MTALLDLREHLPITNPTWIFFLVLCIILFAPVLLNKLKIPHLIGMILAGILIGEHGFDILARDSSFELFGQVGLYYIMFLAGLEMNMEDFPAIRGKAIVFGILAFIIPIVLGFFSNILILKYGIVSSILLASMYASHTLISYPIVTATLDTRPAQSIVPRSVCLTRHAVEILVGDLGLEVAARTIHMK